MFDTLRACHVRENEDCEGFESRFDQPRYQSILTNNSTNPNYTTYDGELEGSLGSYYKSVMPGQSKTVSFKPLSGLLNCGKLLPLRYAPITIELELTQNASDVIMNTDDQGCNVVVTNAGATAYGVAINTSTNWRIENPRVLVDICTLDNSLQNEYAQLLLSGKSLPINYSSYVNQMQSISGQSPAINITRALSRLKSVFVTFDQANQNVQGAGQANVHFNLWKRNWNDFHHPMTWSNQTGYNSAYEMEYQLQVGSKLFPDFPMRTLQEQFYQLRKCMGTESSNFHSLDITPKQYRNHTHIIAFDTEKNLGSAFTGLNIKQGSLINLKMKSVGSSVTSVEMPDTVYVCLHFDSILSIRDSGIEVFE
jgi:hypothetical protein